MQNDPTKPLIENEVNIQSKNNGKRKPTNGFDKHPENINRNGRPMKQWTWKDLLEEVAEEYIDVKKKDGTTTRHQFKELVAKKLYQLAVSGNVGATKELMNRMDGMPQQKVDVEASGNWNVTLKREEK